MRIGSEYKRLMAAHAAHKMLLRGACMFGARICNTLACVGCTGTPGHAFKEDIMSNMFWALTGRTCFILSWLFLYRYVSA